MEAQDSVLRKEEKCEKCKKFINLWDRKARARDKVYHRSCLTCSHCTVGTQADITRNISGEVLEQF